MKASGRVVDESYATGFPVEEEYDFETVAWVLITFTSIAFFAWVVSVATTIVNRVFGS